MSALGELRSTRRAPAARPRRRDNRAAALFLAPWFAGLLLITAGPLIASLVIAFTDYNLIQPPTFTGFDNFTRMLTDDRLHASLRVTFFYVAVSVPLQLLCALG